MSFRPLFSRDRFRASLLVLALVALALLLFIWMLRRPVGPGTVILGALLLALGLIILLFLYRLWALHSLDYWVDRDAVHILWNGEEVIIPMGMIREVQRHPAVRLEPDWRQWPMHWVQEDPQQRVLAYATQPPEAGIAIVTDDETYLISPEDPDAFLQAYEARRAFGPARQLQPVIYLAPWRQHWLLQDRLAQALLFGGLLLGLLLLAYVTWHYPQLPETIVLRYDAAGNPGLLSPRRAVFLIPGVGLLVGFLNAFVGYALYTYQRFLAYLLWSASALFQVAGLYIVVNLIRLATG